MTDKTQYRDLLKEARGRGYKGGKTRPELEAFLAGAALASSPADKPLPVVIVDATFEPSEDKPAPEPNPSDPRAEQRPNTREATGRRARVPLGTARQKLLYASRPGYHRHWFNDTGNRIHAAENAGYEFVEEMNDGRRVKVSRRVGTHEGGQSMTAYLMEIRQEFYDEDQAAKLVVVDEIDAAIRGGEPRGDGADPGAFYAPDAKTSMQADS